VVHSKRHAAPAVQDTAAISCSTRTDVAGEEAIGEEGGGEDQAVASLRRVETTKVIAGDHAERAAIPRAASGCVSNATTLCISDQPGDQRFKVQVHYETSQDGGLSGYGNAISLVSLGVDHGGVFWFFDADNPEMLIKVLDACSVNQKFWVYYSAGTNVGLTVTVTDTETGQSKVYKNADLTPAPPVPGLTARGACRSVPGTRRLAKERFFSSVIICRNCHHGGRTHERSSA
jgi:hypothetical protein